MISYNKLDFAKNAYKIIVDIDEEELKKPTIVPDMPVHADVKDFMRALLKRPYEQNPSHEGWKKWCRNLVKKYPAALPEYFGRGDDERVNPYVFLDKMFAAAESDDCIVCGNGSACVMTFQAAKIKQGQRMFTNSGCAAMGYGLPAALGAAVARKGKRVICVDGDGSIMMNLQELATIAYHKLNLKIILLNNDGYHSIRQTQTNMFKPPLVGVSSDSGVGFPDFEKLADAFSLTYFRIVTEGETDKILAQALATEGPVLVEAMVDPAQNFAPKLSSKVLPDGKIVSAELDDMFPFLSREEYEGNRFLPEKKD
jgi:acetolactate synthase-1/2/3 large subunit